MSSYGSHHSGYLHPSQYPPNPPPQQTQPPYPTTPAPPAPPASQQQPFYPPTPQQQQLQPIYSTSPTYSASPTSHYRQPSFSSSPASYPPGALPMPQPSPHHRRSSSSASHHQRPYFPSQPATAPIAIPSASSSYPPQQFSTPQQHFQQPSYGRRTSSHHSADGSEDKFEGGAVGGAGVYGSAGLDEQTLRSYEKRYRRERELEKRPTLGGSLMSMVRTISGRRD